MFSREFYPLTILAEKWHCTISDLLHLGIQEEAQICINIYGLATDIRKQRVQDLPETFASGTEVPPMPDGIFELGTDALRAMDMPDGFPFDLFDAWKYDKAQWYVEFNVPVSVRAEHLCMLRHEVERIERQYFGNSDSCRQDDLSVADANEPSPNDRAHVSDKLATLNQAAARWWANAKRNDATTHPTNAAVAAWLIERGFSETLADKAATIIRPEWAPAGRKREE